MSGDIVKAESAAFDYAALSAEIADAAQNNARLIIEEEGRARASAVLSIIRVGGWLTEIKAALEHGRFMEWVEAEFRWTGRTAQRYMQAAEVFGEHATHVSYLPPGTMYRLASPSAPEELRQQIVQAAAAGKGIPPDEIEGRLREAREEARERREEARKTPGQRAYQRKTQRRDEQERAERAAREEVRQERIEAATLMIRDALGDRLPEFLALFEGVSSWTVNDVLQRLARSGA